LGRNSAFDHAGNVAIALAAGAVAALALIIFAVGMPETANHDQ
jgi:hypothetical protein